jgi:tetratricopeptide (TPR) repeat protein
MRVSVLAVLIASGLFAADPQQLALELKAQSDFDRVQLAPIPSLADTASCVQSQAAVLPVTAPEDLALFEFRKGLCALAGATVTGNNREYLAAAADFDRAIEAWPSRLRNKAARRQPDPLSSGLRVLPWIARLHAWTNEDVWSAARRELSSALESPSCTSNLMSGPQCAQFLGTAREWLGWIELRENRLDEAARDFAGAQGTGWQEWVEGRRQFQTRNYAAAAAQYRQAIDIWKSFWTGPGPALARRLGPSPEFPQALSDLGGAQLLARDPRAAIASLDAAIKSDPSNAQAFYLRARAHEILGQLDPAISDYNLASRTAFANARDLASGEAHLYRGILLYRRKDFSRAEDEFASALNFEIAQSLRADAQAWRHLAAVSGGACVASREALNRSLPAVSPYFPKDEARQAETACTTSAALRSSLH